MNLDVVPVDLRSKSPANRNEVDVSRLEGVRITSRHGTGNHPKFLRKEWDDQEGKALCNGKNQWALGKTLGRHRAGSA